MERVDIRCFCRIMLISVRACEELDMCWCALLLLPIHADIMVFVVQDFVTPEAVVPSVDRRASDIEDD